MENKTITYSLLGVILFIFIVYFTMQSMLPSEKSIKIELNNIIKYVQENKWVKAEDSVNKLMKSWDRAKYMLAFNYAEEDYAFFIENLARIKGGVKTRDYKEIVNNALSCLKLFDNFTKVVPEP